MNSVHPSQKEPATPEWKSVEGKRVLLTGGTNGIGFAAALELARRGARLTLVARSELRAREAARRIDAASNTHEPADVLIGDLASLASVRRVVTEALERYPAIEVLINNAGAVNSRRRITEDGFELTWAVNHLAPFLLTTQLLDRLKESAPARIVTTSSAAHVRAQVPFDDVNAERGYRYPGYSRYAETKLANILFTRELARRLAGSGVTANCFHPGVVATGFNRNNGPVMRLGISLVKPFMRSAEKGAETLVWLVDSPELGGETGGYFVDERRVAPSAAAQDPEAARRLWDLSERQTRQDGPGQRQRGRRGANPEMNLRT